MTAVALTPQPANAAVIVDITGVPGGQTIASITRTDANGTNTVRTREGQVPIGGQMIVTDFEPALTGPLVYDVVTSAGGVAGASTTLDGTVPLPQIATVQLPQLFVEPELVTSYSSRRVSSSTVHDIIGRTDPVVVQGPSRLRAGRLEVWARTYEEAYAIDAVLASGLLLMLRQPTHPGLDMWFAAAESEVVPLDRTDGGWRWQVVAQYTEIRCPRLPLLGAAGWTYDELRGDFASYAAVRTAFATYADVVVGV